MALTVTPSGPLGLPLKYLRATIAASAQFQTLVGAANAAAALPFVAVGVAEDVETNEDGTCNPLYVAKPRAIIRWPDQSEFGQSAHNQWNWGEGRLMLTFEFPTPSDYQDNWQDAYMNFLNEVGAILSEMKDLANTGGYLSVKRFAIGPIGEAISEENNGERFFCCHVMPIFGGLF